ncbi:hypothetical protein PRVXH_002549 [Proteinivorax hydrogeniformans]|uniref:Oxaloacetate decarboxylase gamma subunit n=1 Tax=Proteinivorax hydrogeniformans TaxID=1826727 RepID=A0AAU8HTS2_9FIRM
MNIFSEFAQLLYELTGVNVALLLAFGFFTGVLVVFSATLLMTLYNLLATRA